MARHIRSVHSIIFKCEKAHVVYTGSAAIQLVKEWTHRPSLGTGMYIVYTAVMMHSIYLSESVSLTTCIFSSRFQGGEMVN